MKLHIHSDNAEWAGCENMPGIFLQNEELNKQFDITFSYRWSKDYFEGMNKWIPSTIPLKQYPLKLFISNLYKVRHYFKPIMLGRYTCQKFDEIPKLEKLFNQINPDIVHINNGGYPGASSCNSAVIAAHNVGIKKITYMINSTVSNPWWAKDMTERIKEIKPQFITASSKLGYEVSYLLNGLVEVIPNTVLYKEPLLTPQQVKRRFGLNKSDIVFLFLGKFVERKGIDTLIESFEFIHSSVPRGLIIAGDGSDNQTVNLYIKAAKKNSFIQIYNRRQPLQCYGDIDDHSLINACDCLVVPSWYDEDFPNVILLALMYGKVVIASDVGGIKEVIDKSGNILVRPGVSYELSNAMEHILSSEFNLSEAKEKSKNAFKIYYNNSKIINEYIKLWKEGG